MRLKCPSCGAEYEVAAHMVPQDGRHVQCSACHTRWFVSPAQEPQPSEDRIIERLEAWSSRPRPVPVPEPALPHGAAEPGAADPDAGENFVWDSPGAAAESGDDEAEEPEAPEGDAEAAPAEADEAAPPADIAKMPPGVPQPRAVPDGKDAAPAAEDPDAAQPAPAAPTRSSSRLDLTVDPDAPPSQPPPQSRFAKGLAIVLAAFVVALAVYSFHDLIAARVPRAAPAIEAYVQFVDDIRQQVAERIAAFIDRA